MLEPEVVAAPAEQAAMSRGRRRPLADVGAVTLLGAVLLWLPAVHGGRTPVGVAGVGMIAIVAAPAAYLGLAGASRAERALLSVLGFALVLHPFVTGYRDGVDEALLRYASVPLIYLTARYSCVRWPRLLPVALPLAGVWIWWQGWAGWLDPPQSIFAAWRVVPWHNPSGVLLGAFVVYATTMVLAGRWRWLHGPVAALCASGLWLSASRASIAMTVLVLVALAAVRLRDRAGMLWLAGVAVAATLVTAGLLAVSPSYGGEGSAVVERSQETVTGVDSPFGARGEASANARARILHVEAALRMFERSPLTGVGLGSYAHYVLDLAEPRMNFTRSAHSEPAEVLGEGGLLVGVPFALLTAAAAIGLLPLLVSRTRPLAGRSAAAAAALLIVGHTLFDVDWGYLLVVGFAAIAVGMARTATDPPADARSVERGMTVLALLLPVALGLTLTVQRSIAQTHDRAGWWEAGPHLDDVADALASGRAPAAGEAAQRARAAAPGDPSTAALRDIVLLARTGDAEALYAVATSHATPLSWTRFAVAALAGLDRDLAADAVAELDGRLAAYHPERVVVLIEQLERLVQTDDDQLSSAS